MSKHDLSELHQLQALSLNEKVERTKARIKQWVEHYGLDHVYVSFSGDYERYEQEYGTKETMKYLKKV